MVVPKNKQTNVRELPNIVTKHVSSTSYTQRTKLDSVPTPYVWFLNTDGVVERVDTV